MDVCAHITGNVWRVLVVPGDRVAEGDEVAILESMKMEMPVESEEAGVVAAVHVSEGDAVDEGQAIVSLGEG